MGSYSLPGLKGSLSETFPRRDGQKNPLETIKKFPKQPNTQPLSCAKALCFAFYLTACQEMKRLSKSKTQDPFPWARAFTGKEEIKQMEKRNRISFVKSKGRKMCNIDEKMWEMDDTLSEREDAVIFTIM